MEASLWILLGKPTFDFLLALALMIVLAPVLFALAVLVKIGSSGPVFYSQVRVGRHGRVFRIYKIRSMYHDCERLTGPQWSTENDPRVTPIGRFLRKSHLDEIPQIWNVLKRDMSFVGPRPERPEFVSKFELEHPRYAERHRVRPGLTGLAQVNLPPILTLESVERKLVHDLYYLENLNFGNDFKILLSTGLFLLGLRFETSVRWLRLYSQDEPTPEPAPVERGNARGRRLDHLEIDQYVSGSAG